MTSQPLLATRGDAELPSQQIAKRIRGLLAENQIKGARLAPLMGLEVKAFNRRLRGEVEWSIDDLSAMAVALGMPFVDLVRHEGLEPPTRCFDRQELIALPGGAQELATVLPFRARLPHEPRRPRPARPGTRSA